MSRTLHTAQWVCTKNCTFKHNEWNVVHIHWKDTLFRQFKCIHKGKFTSVSPLGSTGMYFSTFWTLDRWCVGSSVSDVYTRAATADPPTSHRVPADQRLRYVFLWIFFCISFRNCVSINMRPYLLLKLYFYEYASVFLLETVFLWI